MTSNSRLFGTDGIRGLAGLAPLDRPSLLRLGRSLGAMLARPGSAPKIVLAGDTRSSTPDLCAWLASGLEQVSCAPRFGGVLPTPAVARLTSSLDAELGIAVSASHNPYPDNGVKLLDRNGFKWEVSQERELERLFATEPARPTDFDTNSPTLAVDETLAEQYLEQIASRLPERALEGLSLVIDCANGAASGLAASLFERLGARVTTLADQPNGTNINRDCGSMHPESAARQTRSISADIGFAFDGDADRAIAIDETGAIQDGDAILYVLAGWLAVAGELDPPRIVATSMSNLGLEKGLRTQNIELVRCDVGDRTVVRTLRELGLILGGEQSGHIVHLGMTPTGDGLLTAALLSHVVRSSGQPLSELVTGFERFPQILHNVQVPSKPDFESLPRVVSEARRVEEQLGDHGRLVLRYSGTEPLARVMIEGRDQDEIEALARTLATTIVEEIEAIEDGA